MSGGGGEFPEGWGEYEAFLADVRRHDEELAAVVRRGRQRLAFSLAISVFWVAGTLVSPLVYVPLAIFVAFTAVQLYRAAVPGRCWACGQWTPYSIPRVGVDYSPAWWDLRVLSRRRQLFCCLQHFPTLARLRIRHNR